MRLINVILTALFAAFALVAGLVAAALVALAGSVFFFVRRLVRPPVLVSTNRSQWQPKGEADVIEVTATEVAAERVGPPER